MNFLKKIAMLVVLAAAADPVVAAESLGVADATPGRRGICVTEMDGGERVEIPLTVLGTIGSGGPEGEIVLIRLDDPRFEETGIIAGMSGSPVYLDGKLLGALAYGWGFSKAPIGGVTPFERMLRIEGAPAQPMAAVSRPAMTELLAAAADGSLGSVLADWLVPERADSLQPLPMTLATGGWWTPSGGSWIAETWRRLGWMANAGSAGRSDDSGTEIAPGDMVAGLFVDGDAILSAAGTVTEVRDDVVWAFGHSSLGLGTAITPMARARVIAVLPSLQNSFKFFDVGAEIGALVADRKDGIVGRLGQKAPMVPTSVTVNGRRYDFRIVQHPLLMPLFAAYVAQASQGVLGRVFGDQTVSIRTSIHYPDLSPVVVNASFSGGQALSDASSFTAMAIAYLENSAFVAPQIEKIDIEIESTEEIRSATIVEIVPDRRVVRPGELLDVRFRIKPHKGREEIRKLTLKVPEGLKDGKLDLVGSDGAAWTAYDLLMRPLRPSSFADEVRLLNSLEPSTVIVAALERPDVGVSLAGGSLSAPPSIVMQMQSALGPNLEKLRHTVFAKAEETLPMPVFGAQRISLTVRSSTKSLER